MQFSSNGLITFNDQFASNQVMAFPRSAKPRVPIVAPLWTDIASQNTGDFYMRLVRDQATLFLVKLVLLKRNPDLVDYQPSEALVATWHEVQLRAGPTVSLYPATLWVRSKCPE